MFERIMVPVDGSELAERALGYVERIAPITGATIHLVEVVQVLPSPALSYVPTVVPEGAYEAGEEEAAGYLVAMRQRLAAAGVGDVRAVELDGEPASRLLDYEREANIDLVVMCSHGRTGMARFALGSVAERLIQYGAIPVVLVRAFGEVAVPRHVLVPLDGSERAEAALDTVERLPTGIVREVTLLRVIRSAEEGSEADRYLQGIAGRLQRVNLEAHRRVEQGDPAQRIVEAAGSDKFVVMTTHGRTALTRWALGSVAERVVRGGVSAVMLVRRPG